MIGQNDEIEAEPLGEQRRDEVLVADAPPVGGGVAEDEHAVHVVGLLLGQQRAAVAVRVGGVRDLVVGVEVAARVRGEGVEEGVVGLEDEARERVLLLDQPRLLDGAVARRGGLDRPALGPLERAEAHGQGDQRDVGPARQAHRHDRPIHAVVYAQPVPIDAIERRDPETARRIHHEHRARNGRMLVELLERHGLSQL